MSATATPTKIRLKILRRANSQAESYWEEYVIPFREKLNVISARNPGVVRIVMNTDTAPWDNAELRQAIARFRGKGKFAVGFAESEGLESGDQIFPDLHRYRDYVIRAFNSDKPYTQFMREQIAGEK